MAGLLWRGVSVSKVKWKDERHSLSRDLKSTGFYGLIVHAGHLLFALRSVTVGYIGLYVIDKALKVGWRGMALVKWGLCEHWSSDNEWWLFFKFTTQFSQVKDPILSLILLSLAINLLCVLAFLLSSFPQLCYPKTNYFSLNFQSTSIYKPLLMEQLIRSETIAWVRQVTLQEVRDIFPPLISLAPTRH